MPNVTVNLPAYRKGSMISVPGLGGFENGSTTEVSQAKFDKFVAGKDQYKGKSSIVIGDTQATLRPSLKPEPEEEAKPVKKKAEPTPDENKEGDN